MDQKILLNNGVEVTIPSYFEYGKCKGCQADDIIWATTSNGKKTPIHWVDGEWVSHFSDCPKAGEFRNLKKT